MVKFDEDTSDEDITAEEIRATKNLLNRNVKRYYKEPESKTPKSVLAEILKLPPNEEFADGSKSYLVNSGTYRKNDEVFDAFSVLNVSPNKFSSNRGYDNEINFYIDAHVVSGQNVYYGRLYGDNRNRVLLLASLGKINIGLNEEVELTKEDLPKIANVFIPYLMQTASDVGIDTIYVSSAIQRIKDKETQDTLRRRIDVFAKMYNVKII